jgi:hypothetical protein
MSWQIQLILVIFFFVYSIGYLSFIAWASAKSKETKRVKFSISPIAALWQLLSKH